jgi:hypothetical protein
VFPLALKIKGWWKVKFEQGAPCALYIKLKRKVSKMRIKQSLANKLMDTMAEVICCAYANVEDAATQEALEEFGATFIQDLTREQFENFCESVGIDTVVEGV